MIKKIALFDAHPDPDPARFVHALAAAYAAGGREVGHEVRPIMLGGLNVPILRSRDEWMNRPVPEVVRPGQEAILWADHLIFFYPLWLGDMPALLKAYLEHVMRPGFSLEEKEGEFPKKIAQGALCAHRRDHGYARLFLPRLLRRAQCTQLQAQHPRWHRD